MSKISLKRLANLFVTFFWACASYATVNGSIQKVIHFAGTANEIFFFGTSVLLTIIFAYLTISE